MKRPSEVMFLLLRLALGAIFVGASVYKIATPGAFAHEIHNYQILPDWAVNPSAIVLPWLQLFCGLSLIFNRLSRGGSLIIVAMMAAFQFAVASALIRGLNISCGCFHAGGATATWRTFARDSLILIAALIQLARSWPCQAKPVDGNH
jgi:uncharacterized membrane protein YphA (DoxX/SURF4 family)